MIRPDPTDRRPHADHHNVTKSQSPKQAKTATAAAAAPIAGLVSRRQALVAGMALPMMASLPPSAEAKAPPQGAGQPLFQRFRLGDWEVTSLMAGASRNDEPHKTFGLNVSDADFAAASQAAFIPADWTAGGFVPVLVNTGEALVLFDTGMSAAGTLAALTAAGIEAGAVDLVVLTHMHGDHIGGLTGEDGSPTFANARYATGREEYEHWAQAGNAGFDAKVRPLADKITQVTDGEEVAPGITAIAAFGHTPGHMVYRLESAGRRLFLTADTANHHVWSLQYPDWEVRFDMDKPMAAEARRKVFGMIAEERAAFIGYHMPFPGLGYVEAMGEGFRFVPHSYQLAILP